MVYFNPAPFAFLPLILLPLVCFPCFSSSVCRCVVPASLHCRLSKSAPVFGLLLWPDPVNRRRRAWYIQRRSMDNRTNMRRSKTPTGTGFSTSPSSTEEYSNLLPNKPLAADEVKKKRRGRENGNEVEVIPALDLTGARLPDANNADPFHFRDEPSSSKTPLRLMKREPVKNSPDFFQFDFEIDEEKAANVDEDVSVKTKLKKSRKKRDAKEENNLVKVKNEIESTRKRKSPPRMLTEVVHDGDSVHVKQELSPASDDPFEFPEQEHSKYWLSTDKRITRRTQPSQISSASSSKKSRRTEHKSNQHHLEQTSPEMFNHNMLGKKTSTPVTHAISSSNSYCSVSRAIRAEAAAAVKREESQVFAVKGRDHNVSLNSTLKYEDVDLGESDSDQVDRNNGTTMMVQIPNPLPFSHVTVAAMNNDEFEQLLRNEFTNGGRSRQSRFGYTSSKSDFDKDNALTIQNLFRFLDMRGNQRKAEVDHKLFLVDCMRKEESFLMLMESMMQVRENKYLMETETLTSLFNRIIENFRATMIREYLETKRTWEGMLNILA